MNKKIIGILSVIAVLGWVVYTGMGDKLVSIGGLSSSAILQNPRVPVVPQELVDIEKLLANGVPLQLEQKSPPEYKKRVKEQNEQAKILFQAIMKDNLDYTYQIEVKAIRDAYYAIKDIEQLPVELAKVKKDIKEAKKVVTANRKWTCDKSNICGNIKNLPAAIKSLELYQKKEQELQENISIARNKLWAMGIGTHQYGQIIAIGDQVVGSVGRYGEPNRYELLIKKMKEKWWLTAHCISWGWLLANLAVCDISYRQAGIEYARDTSSDRKNLPPTDTNGNVVYNITPGYFYN